MCHLDDGREWRGGQHQVGLLMEGLADRGLEQVLFTAPESPLGKRLRERGLRVEEIDFKGEFDFAAPRAIASIAIDFGADILHAHTAHAHTIAIRAQKRINRKRKGNLASLVVTRRVDFAVGHSFFSRRKYRYPRQNFIAISEAVFQALVDGGVDPNRIDIVNSGVPAIPTEQALSREASRALFGIQPNEDAIVTVGALTDHKGHKYFVEAAAAVRRRFPRARFWILGEGELRPKLEAQCVELGLADYVHLPGYVPDARLKLAGFDLYVSSSHLEGMGTAILDAMLSGLPVVAAAAGGVTDIVRPNVTGRLVPPRDSAALARAIIDELEMPDQPKRIAIKRAKEFAETNFSARQMVEGTLNVYRRLRQSS